jgi:peptide/nickel transport system permease protein
MASDSVLDQPGQPGQPGRAEEPTTAAGVVPPAPGQPSDGPEPIIIPPNEPQTVVSARFGDDDRVNVASQWTLMWWKFRKHKLALISSWIVVGLYVVAVFVEVIAPYDPEQQDVRSAYQPPTALHLWDTNGTFRGPFVYGVTRKRNLETLSQEYADDTSKVYPVSLWVKGAPYALWGMIPLEHHLFGVDDPGRVFLFGADRQGRDMFSRVVYGTRISMSVGLIGVILSFGLGIVFGGISGFYGGWMDTLIQRVIEILRSIPTIPLWMGLSAALPPNWPPVQVYFGVTVILSLVGWTGLARVVRGRFLSLREEDFVMAAKLSGSSERVIVFKHLVPSFTSHIIAALTLAVPEMILSETALSFLGLGLRFPAISWGVLLQEAQNIRSVAEAPWLLAPAGAVVLAVLALNFLGDGLRDAADPYR